MGGLLLCGKRSETPFYIKDLDMNIYSLEEINYYLFNYTYLMNREFFSKDLVEFVEIGLEQPSLARKLNHMIEHKGSFAHMASLIIKESGYYEEEESAEIHRLLETIESKTPVERLKARADIFMKCKKYGNALKVYKNIIETEYKEPEQGESRIKQSFYAKIFHNMGIIYALLFLYEEAIGFLEKAYLLDSSKNHLRRLVIVAILRNDEEKLSQIIKKYGVSDELFSICNGILNDERTKILESKAYNAVEQTLTYNGKGNIEEHYEEVQALIHHWKTEYRDESM